MNRNVEIAKRVILTYLGKDLNADSVREIYEIKRNSKVLLEHIKALKKIFEDAIKELEKE